MRLYCIRGVLSSGVMRLYKGYLVLLLTQISICNTNRISCSQNCVSLYISKFYLAPIV